MAKTRTIDGVEFTIVNANTEQAKTIIRRYNNSDCYRLYQAYKYSYSNYKARAEQEILDEMQKLGGYSYRITGAGSCFFSCAYRLAHDGKQYIVFHTPTDRKLVPIA